ncbi:ABC transporter permease [Corynebacterium sp. H130]|uniref:ABC transporter permease n=1 Tax=Corynebacterium sp. H130 TaxID=3133444 RepID=UPI0030A5A948
MRGSLESVPRLIGRRLVAIALTSIAVTAVVFGLAAASPFDPLAYRLGSQYGKFTPGELEQLRSAAGFDKPWWQQLLSWWGGLLRGDAGFSHLYNKPVADVMAERVPWTLVLSGAGLIIALVGAVGLGIWAAWQPEGLVAKTISFLGVALAATPTFVYALGIIVVFGTLLHLIPLGGAAPPGTVPTLGGMGPYLIAPAFVLGLSQLPWPLLAMEEASRSAWNSPAVEAAQLRGLSRWQVLVGHVLPMSVLPMVTVFGTRLGELVVGAVIIESVFSWPGLAQATVESALAVDFSLLAVITVATTVLVMVGSLMSDVAYLVLDPRVSDV